MSPVTCLLVLLAHSSRVQHLSSDQWLRFKREFTQFLVAVDKGQATEEVKLEICLRTVSPGVNDLHVVVRRYSSLRAKMAANSKEH